MMSDDAPQHPSDERPPHVPTPAAPEDAANERSAWPDDPDAAPSPDELAESARLRDALDDPSSSLPDAELARALRNVVEPRPLEIATHTRLLEAALLAARGNVVALHSVSPPQRARPRSARVFALSGAFAAAAAVLLAIGLRVGTRSAMTRADSLRAPRDASDLFDSPFPRVARVGDVSARVDRIASSRERDLRANQFAKWGVR